MTSAPPSPDAHAAPPSSDAALTSTDRLDALPSSLAPFALGALATSCWAALPLMLHWVWPRAIEPLVGLGADHWAAWAAGLAWVLVLLGSMLLIFVERIALGRALTTLALLGSAALIVWSGLDMPLSSTLATGGALVLIAGLWGTFDDPSRTNATDTTRRFEATFGALIGTCIVWGVAWTLALRDWDGRLALVGALVYGGWGMVRTARPGAEVERRLGWTVAGLGLLPALPVVEAASLALPAMLASGFAVAYRRAQERLRFRDSEPSLVETLVLDPAWTVVGTFAIGGLVGGLLLALPIASGSGAPHDLLDALFTAFSAICVTGLAVLDTPNAFNFVGQAILLTLIQIGGLGIMTLSTAAFLLLGERISVRHEATAASLIQAQDRRQIWDTLKVIFGVTLAVELVGALALAACFVANGDGVWTAAWRGLFTSISAFCNAGFALQSDSLVSYQAQPWTLLIIAAIILAGGTGPLVFAELAAWRRGLRLTLQTRLVLLASLALTLGGFALIGLVEWDNTLGHLAPIDRAVNAFFQSVTLRTAGFNSIDLAALKPATLWFVLLPMFIGGNPGSTAGGIKTTTAVALMWTVLAALREERAVSIGGFTLDEATARKAVAVGLVALGGTALVCLALLITHPSMPLPMALFETVSALATVGLSTGGTAMLDEVGKILIIVAMFAGRVGPLTLLLVLAKRSHDTARHSGRLPSTRMDIG